MPGRGGEMSEQKTGANRNRCPGAASLSGSSPCGRSNAVDVMGCLFLEPRHRLCIGTLHRLVWRACSLKRTFYIMLGDTMQTNFLNKLKKTRLLIEISLQHCTISCLPFESLGMSTPLGLEAAAKHALMIMR